MSVLKSNVNRYSRRLSMRVNLVVMPMNATFAFSPKFSGLRKAKPLCPV